ncbi:hypothetical protein OROMI_031276 [Orobanche minor]
MHLINFIMNMQMLVVLVLEKALCTKIKIGIFLIENLIVHVKDMKDKVKERDVISHGVLKQVWDVVRKQV